MIAWLEPYAVSAVLCLAVALAVGGLVQATKSAVGAAGRHVRDHRATKVALRLLPVALGAASAALLPHGPVPVLLVGLAGGGLAQGTYYAVRGRLPDWAQGRFGRGGSDGR